MCVENFCLFVCWVFVIRYSIFDIRYSVFGTPYSVLGTRDSVLGMYSPITSLTNAWNVARYDTVGSCRRRPVGSYIMKIVHTLYYIVCLFVGRALI